MTRHQKLQRRARSILEVDADADLIIIKKAYWIKAMECHPDKHPNDTEANERFCMLVKAYEFLVESSDPGHRFLNVGEDKTIGKYHENEWGYFCWWRESFQME